MTGVELLGVKAAAAELGLSVATVHRRIQDGDLAAEKIGDGRTSSYVITRAELDRVKAEQQEATA